MELYTPSRLRAYLFKHQFACTYAQRLWNSTRYIMRGTHSYLVPDNVRGSAFESLPGLRKRIMHIRRVLESAVQYKFAHNGGPECPECKRIAESGVINRCLTLAEDIIAEQEQLVADMIKAEIEEQEPAPGPALGPLTVDYVAGTING